MNEPTASKDFPFFLKEHVEWNSVKNVLQRFSIVGFCTSSFWGVRFGLPCYQMLILAQKTSRGQENVFLKYFWMVLLFSNCSVTELSPFIPNTKCFVLMAKPILNVWQLFSSAEGRRFEANKQRNKEKYFYFYFSSISFFWNLKLKQNSKREILKMKIWKLAN